MTERLDAHMDHPGVVAAQAALNAHLAEHCWWVVHQRDLCAEGRRLHDAVVIASQKAYRAARPEAFAPEPHDG